VISRVRAVRLKCLDCAGSPNEVTLCHIFDRPLWSYRFGGHYKTNTSLKRMAMAKKRYPKELLEIKRILQKDGNEYFNNIQNKEVKAHIECFFGLN